MVPTAMRFSYLLRLMMSVDVDGDSEGVAALVGVLPVLPPNGGEWGLKDPEFVPFSCPSTLVASSIGSCDFFLLVISTCTLFTLRLDRVWIVACR